jgi:hypothetical protein
MMRYLFYFSKLKHLLIHEHTVEGFYIKKNETEK